MPLPYNLDSCPQDVLGLARHLLEVLCNPGVAAQLQQSARATALRFTPDAIADRCAALWSTVTCRRSPFMGDRKRSRALPKRHVEKVAVVRRG